MNLDRMQFVTDFIMLLVFEQFLLQYVKTVTSNEDAYWSRIHQGAESLMNVSILSL